MAYTVLETWCDSPAYSGLAAQNLFLRSFPAAVQPAVLAALEPVTLPAHATLFRQHDPADSLYILVNGRLAVSLHSVDGGAAGAERVVNELTPGATVGEIALLSGLLRSATVHALEPAELLRLSREAFEHISARYPHAMERFAGRSAPRLRRAQLEAALTTLFGPLSGTLLNRLEERVEWRQLKRGETLFSQGEVGDWLYMVISGRLRVTRMDGQGDEQWDEQGTVPRYDEVGRGESVGELALVTGEPRAATVCAIRDSLVVGLSQTEFDRLRLREPEAMMEATRHIVQSLLHSIRSPRCAPRRTTGGTTAPITTIALIPASRAVDLSAFAAALTSSLQTLCPALHLSREHFDTALSRAGTTPRSNTPLAALIEESWLSEQERTHRYIVYESDLTCTPWTQRTLHQADRILLVGLADGDPLPGEIEQQLQGLPSPPRLDLVLLSPADGSAPTTTGRWLSLRNAHTHYHVRNTGFQHEQRHNRADMDRLARLTTGHGVGLVLSGGSAHGLAHIGALRAFDEAGIPVDVVGGVSIGALIGAAHVMGLDHREITQLVRTLSARKHWLDLTFPAASFLSGHKITRVLQTVFGERNLEELPRPFFCVSTNLTRGELVLHQRGPAWYALRASSSMPGVFAPVPTADGDLLVDGANQNNMPVDLIQSRYGVETTAAVDVVAGGAIRGHFQYGPSLSGWHALWNRLLPPSRRVHTPGLLQTIARMTVVSSMQHGKSRRDEVELYIRPDLDDFGMFEFGRYDELIECGYRAASVQIEAWSQGQ